MMGTVWWWKWYSKLKTKKCSHCFPEVFSCLDLISACHRHRLFWYINKYHIKVEGSIKGAPYKTSTVYYCTALFFHIFYWKSFSGKFICQFTYGSQMFGSLKQSWMGSVALPWRICWGQGIKNLKGCKTARDLFFPHWCLKLIWAGLYLGLRFWGPSWRKHYVEVQLTTFHSTLVIKHSISVE